MIRWRWYLGILVLLAVALWIALFVWNFRPELAPGVPPPGLPIPDAGRFRMPLTGLPVWLSLPGTFISFFLAGVGILYTFPSRERRIKQSITVSVLRFFQITMLGFGISLLFLFLR